MEVYGDRSQDDYEDDLYYKPPSNNNLAKQVKDLHQDPSYSNVKDQKAV